jgi:5'-3' exoribonuclease 2
MNAASIGVSFQFIKIKAVREFIHINYVNCTFNLSFKYDLERVIDDFIFLCFFVGNDFLPHIPCLSIRDGGIDVLMRVY